MKTKESKTLWGSKAGQAALCTLALSGVFLFNPVYAVIALSVGFAAKQLCRMTDGERDTLLSRLTVCMAVLLMAVPVFAAGDSGAVGALNEVGTEFKNLLPAAKTVCNAIAAIIALIGGLTIMMKLNNGDQDVKKTAMLVIGGCTAFVVLAESLPAMFNS